MEIKGFIDLSLVDWDGKVSSVAFLAGCNLRCPFCYNTTLVLHPEKLPTIPFEQIQSFRRLSAVEEKPPGTLNLVAFGDAQFEIRTARPVEARGAYGMRKMTDRVWFSIDDPATFQDQLGRHLEQPG